MQTPVELIRKYNVPGPRYTSYPTVPYWQEEAPQKPGFQVAWKVALQKAAQESTNGISLYIHMPYCQSLCTYCGCNTHITVNHAVEEPYIDALLKEWAMYRKYLGTSVTIAELHLGGGTPTFFSPQNLERLIKGILKTVNVAPNADFGIEAHPTTTTRAHLEALHGLGFKRISFGIQDFDPEVQKTINRIQPLEAVKQAVSNARQVGFTSINFDLIFGLPKQDVNTIRHTISQTLTLRPDRIAFYSYAHVPWLKPAQLSYEKHLPSQKLKRLLYEEGRHMLENIGYVEVGMDHFALPTDALYEAAKNGHLHRNFMGYTPRPTRLLIGLGASSISDAWTAFAQNAKAVGPYLEKINAGQFPIVKGHMHTYEDMVLRQHIGALMTQGYTRWDWQQNELCLALPEALERLAEMEADGLVLCTPTSISITDTGKPFVRNICMALDARLWRKQPTKTLFSQTV